MTALVTADEKGRIPIRGSQPGQKYLITQSGGEWRVTAYSPEMCPSRNRKQWRRKKGKKGLFDHLTEMADMGLQLEPSPLSKQPIPPCRF